MSKLLTYDVFDKLVSVCYSEAATFNPSRAHDFIPSFKCDSCYFMFSCLHSFLSTILCLLNLLLVTIELSALRFMASYYPLWYIHCRVPDKEWSFQDGGL